MKFKTHHIDEIKIAELVSDDCIINGAEDGLDLLGNVYYQGFDKIIIKEQNIIADFFDLKTGLAGEILQKFANYRVRLVIIGDFSKYTSKSLKALIYESNRGRQINFVASQSEAIEVLSRR